MALSRAEGLIACGILAGVMVMALPCGGWAARVEDFPERIPLQGDQYGKLTRVTIPREILSEGPQSLDDIRIFDDLNRETAFLIQTPGEEAATEIPWEIQGSQTIGQDQVYLLGRRSSGDFVKDLVVFSGQRWACSDIEVHSSTDGSLWRMLSSGRIADLRPLFKAGRMSIDLPETCAPFLKVVLRNPGPAGAVMPEGCLVHEGRETGLPTLGHLKAATGFISHATAEGRAGAAFEEKIVEEFEARQDNQDNTVIDIGYLGLPVREISLKTGQGCFYHEILFLTSVKGEETPYELKASGAVYAIPSLGLFRDTLQTDLPRVAHARIRILNHGKPVPGPWKITLRWFRTELLFIPVQGRSYSIFFGARDVPRGPYELGRTPGSVAEAVWKAGGPVRNEAYKPKRTTQEDLRIFILISAVILVVYCIGFWAIQLRNFLPRK